MTNKPRFYRDYGDPQVEHLARAACRALGGDPDALVQETGYDDSAVIPNWWKHQSDAASFLAMHAALATMPEGENR